MAADPSPVATEYADRREREHQKAIRKYGLEGQPEDGHPGYDILDYAINELVGLVRYAEMIEARMRKIERLVRRKAVGNAAREGVKQARQLFAMSGQRAFDLIEVRQALIAQGLHLGRTEGGDAAS